jgi:hypothetical protein
MGLYRENTLHRCLQLEPEELGNRTRAAAEV